ncbi:MAG: hypothetical protein IPK83_17745 [Planctomycetes bacterium]|nr:hypothetical protein [Planctomycetota bacterium]
MKTLRTIHVYLGCAFAPLLVFFLLSGLLQIFELHEGRKDGSYQPPRWVAELASVHMHQRLSPNAPQQRDPNWPMRIVTGRHVCGIVFIRFAGHCDGMAVEETAAHRHDRTFVGSDYSNRDSGTSTRVWMRKKIYIS